jgi:hypothetical protein
VPPAGNATTTLEGPIPRQPHDAPRGSASQLPEFHRATLDSLQACIAVLDDTGTTIAVNTTLDRIPALKAGGELRLGADYLASCEAAAAAGDEHRGAIAQALREMLAGDRDAFTGRYALGGSDEAPRWFGMRASRFRGAGAGCIVMEHFDKTIFVKAQLAAQLGAETVEYTDAAVLATDLHGRITETALMQDERLGRTFVERVGALGCELALDDFGTGYGGFGYLKNLPVDYLKIDVEFVSDLRTNVASRHVVQAVVGLAEAFGNRTVAEGVEDDETLEMVGRMGVDYAQGFGIGRPAPLDETLYSAS